jgi:glycerophosphoryl diester phosphodiesterase
MITFAIVFACALAVLFIIYLILIAPSHRPLAKEFKTVKYAHRGLHDLSLPENSLPAFLAAVEAGFGIELDVRLTRDEVMVVFHDDDLVRMCNKDVRVASLSYTELCEYTLLDSGITIPTLADVLSVVDGAVPLLIEIKEDAGNCRVSERLAEELRDYKGKYIIESFNPLSLGRIKKLMPKVQRGFLSQRFLKSENKEFHKPLYFVLQNLLINRISSPSFIAYDIKGKDSLSLRIARRLLGAVTIAWTVRSAEEEALAKKAGFDTVICENYIPEK